MTALVPFKGELNCETTLLVAGGCVNVSDSLAAGVKTEGPTDPENVNVVVLANDETVVPGVTSKPETKSPA